MASISSEIRTSERKEDKIANKRALVSKRIALVILQMHYSCNICIIRIYDNSFYTLLTRLIAFPDTFSRRIIGSYTIVRYVIVSPLLIAALSPVY